MMRNIDKRLEVLESQVHVDSVPDNLKDLYDLIEAENLNSELYSDEHK